MAKYSANVGDGINKSIQITHGLGTTDLTGVAVWELSGNHRAALVETRIIDSNNISLEFSTVPSSSAYRVVVSA